MRFPWVSRAIYDELRTDYRALFEKYDALKVAGAVSPEPVPTLERREADPVTQAIVAMAGTDRQLRALMSKEATQARRLGIDDADIIRDIYRGIPDDVGLPA